MKGNYTLEIYRKELKCKLIDNDTKKSQEYSNPNPLIFEMCRKTSHARCFQAGFSVKTVEK